MTESAPTPLRRPRADQARILIGRPPIPVRDALPCLREGPLIDDLRRKRTT